MKRCEDDDRIFSGRTSAQGKFEFICGKCGELGWSDSYELAQVDADKYYSARVWWGWPVPRLPAPPPMPTNTSLPEPSTWPFVPGVVFFTLLASVCALASIPWGALGPIMPLWMSMIGSGTALGTATLLYVCWKKGL